MQHACGIDGRCEQCGANDAGDRTRQRRGHGSPPYFKNSPLF